MFSPSWTCQSTTFFSSVYLDNIPKCNNCVIPKQETNTDAYIHSSGNEVVLTFFSKGFDPITHSLWHLVWHILSMKYCLLKLVLINEVLFLGDLSSLLHHHIALYLPKIKNNYIHI